MTISIGDTIPSDCTQVRKGTVLRLFDAKCTYKLLTFPSNPPGPVEQNPQFRYIPKEEKKDYYIALERDNQIELCDVDNPAKPFAKKGFMFRSKVKRTPKCPFDRTLRYHMEAIYNEATNPFNGVDSELVVVEDTWNPGQASVTRTLTTNSIGDPHIWGSSGIASVDLTLSVVDDHPEDSCREPGIRLFAKLNNLGMGVNHWYSWPDNHTHNTGCQRFRDGLQILSGFWTGAHFKGIFGLVMSFSYRVYALP